MYKSTLCLVCYTAVFSVVTKNGCVAAYIQYIVLGVNEN